MESLRFFGISEMMFVGLVINLHILYRRLVVGQHWSSAGDCLHQSESILRPPPPVSGHPGPG